MGLDLGNQFKAKVGEIWLEACSSLDNFQQNKFNKI